MYYQKPFVFSVSVLNLRPEKNGSYLRNFYSKMTFWNVLSKKIFFYFSLLIFDYWPPCYFPVLFLHNLQSLLALGKTESLKFSLNRRTLFMCNGSYGKRLCVKSGHKFANLLILSKELWKKKIKKKKKKDFLKDFESRLNSEPKNTDTFSSATSSWKHTYIILTPLNPTFIL